MIEENRQLVTDELVDHIPNPQGLLDGGRTLFRTSELSQAAWHLDKALGFRVQAQPYYLLSAPLPPLPYQNADGKALPTLWLALLRGGVLFSSLIFSMTSMLYSDK